MAVKENYEIFDSVDSIENEVVSKYGAISGEDFNSIITKCQEEGDIEDFVPYYRPSNLSGLNSSDQFIGFPLPRSTGSGAGSTIIWHCKQVFIT